MKTYNIVVFGGTGYTGEHVVRELLLTYEKEDIKWAIAGRSINKMRSVLQKVSEELSIADYSSVGVVVANVDDLASVNDMCSSTNLLINCVGPYYLWGRQVVEGCLNGKTHYLDISGEPLFMEQMEAEYNKQAEELGIVIASACGFDSIPADVGVRYVQTNFPGTLTAIESFMNVKVGEQGFSVHLPTFQCIVNGFSNQPVLSKFRRERNLPKLPKFGEVLKHRGSVFREGGLFCAPFAGSDRSVVMRSQRYLYEKEKIVPVQAAVYMTFQSVGLFLYLCMFGVLFMALVSTRFGRKLLLKYPKLCTLGLVSSEGATSQQIEQTTFTFNFKASGYSGEIKGAPDTFMGARISGPEPGYVSCSRFVTQAAYCILKHKPRNVGVVTPAVALDTEEYVKRLQTRGISFELIR